MQAPGHIALQILQVWGEEFGRLFGPFNSVYKIEGLIQKAKSQENIVWVLKSIQDGLAMKTLQPGSITVNSLKQTIVPLALLKQSLLHELLYTFLDSKPFTSQARQVMRARLANHSTVRASIVPSVDIEGTIDIDVDMSWGATQSEPAMKMVQAIEGMVYGEWYDTPLKVALKAGKGADAIINNYPSVTED